MKLNIFGIELLKFTGQGVILLEGYTFVIIEWVTIFCASIIFLVNLTFTFLCLLLLYFVTKRGSFKGLSENKSWLNQANRIRDHKSFQSK